MIGQLSVEQILALSRDGAPAEEISNSLGIPLERVKLALASNNQGSIEDRDIDDGQLTALRKHAYDLAMFAEDDSTKARMTMFLLERDKPKQEKALPTNIVLINQAIAAGNHRFSEILKEYSA